MRRNYAIFRIEFTVLSRAEPDVSLTDKSGRCLAAALADERLRTSEIAETGNKTRGIKLCGGVAGGKTMHGKTSRGPRSQSSSTRANDDQDRIRSTSRLDRKQSCDHFQKACLSLKSGSRLQTLGEHGGNIAISQQ